MKTHESNLIGTPSAYLVHCVKDEDFGSCGASSYLTKNQYMQQLGNPNKGWSCPQCGCYPCEWDDANYEKFSQTGLNRRKKR